MKILFADAFEQSGLDALTEAGLVVDYRPQLTSDDLAAALDDAEVLVVRSTRVAADVFEVDSPLGLVIRA
ncbi:MAG: hydroxyacid dehydrogenase, partial [Acidimicrobiia bacterium]